MCVYVVCVCVRVCVCVGVHVRVGGYVGVWVSGLCVWYPTDFELFTLVNHQSENI